MKPTAEETIRDTLLKALIAARGHLDYCGYGDGWERECAEEQGLEKQIEAAILVANSKQEEVTL